MEKEALLLDNIMKDLRTVADFQLSRACDWRLSFIIPAVLLSVIVGILLKSLWVSLLILSFAAYHTVRFAMEYRAWREKKRAVESVIARKDVSISTEKLSHISTETVYEPHTSVARTHTTVTVRVFHFVGGRSWRVPEVNRHYGWSKEYSLSSKGLENISVSGDEFLFVSLQGYGDVAYVYPCKLFVKAAE